ncbi:hypothetical protein BOTBODRAFT_159695 [Botryobasidium botryosum FD-172 SS1]|uniref:Uncharacterized protein n=1 Tax=Botryobasidium botryosum (strain FD-172 SS1) TaxID=930990 RepID=A0A067MHF8_BOTB1|nr:hypothetical protein BOTBODRAFT_159695 [Botryobasidium botryosum FD-172 SS1]
MKSRFFRKTAGGGTKRKRREDDNDDQSTAEPRAKLPKRKHKRALTPLAASSEPSDLLQLLDFRGISSHHEISERFEKIASALFHKYRLHLTTASSKEEYEILELEFYLQIEGVHEDPFCHGTNEQTVAGNWYFHRAPRRSTAVPAKPKSSLPKPTAAGGYRGGTRKGLDLTFGNAVNSPGPNPTPAARSPAASPTRGGILLRSIRRASDKSVISGPSLLVDEILKRSGANNISQLVDIKWSGYTSAFFPAPTSDTPAYPTLRLAPYAQAKFPAPPPPIYCSPRIGLDLSHPSATASATNPRVIYLPKPHRYFIHPHLLTANGRGHTFLGVHETALLDANEHTQSVKRRVSEITGIREATVEAYAEHYAAGLKLNGRIDGFVGAKGKGAGSSPSSFLKMMGALKGLHATDLQGQGHAS